MKDKKILKNEIDSITFQQDSTNNYLQALEIYANTSKPIDEKLQEFLKLFKSSQAEIDYLKLENEVLNDKLNLKKNKGSKIIEYDNKIDSYLPEAIAFVNREFKRFKAFKDFKIEEYLDKHGPTGDGLWWTFLLDVNEDDFKEASNLAKAFFQNFLENNELSLEITTIE